MTLKETHRVQRNPNLRAPIKLAAKSQLQETKGDSFEKGTDFSPAPSKPTFETAPAPKPVVMTDHPDAAGLSGFARGVSMALVGVIGIGALGGCTPQAPSTGSTVSQNSEAMKTLNQSFDAIQKSMTENGDQDPSAIAGQMFETIAEYSRTTGEKGEELMGNLAGTIRKHPAIAATVAFSAGTAVGVSLDQFGVVDEMGETAGEIAEWAKNNKLKAAGIAIGVAGAGYLIYNHLIKPMAEVPEAPEGEHAEAMEKTFEQLENELKDYEGDPGKKAAEVTRTLSTKIKDYAKATGRNASEIRNDVTAWAYDHPIVATSLVAGAGVATGVLLSDAGVPDYVATAAGVAFDAAGDGLGSVADYAKENPVVAGVVTAAVAAGAGYVIYQAVNNG